MPENVVTDGWTITHDAEEFGKAEGWSATYWRNGAGLVSTWQPTFDELLTRLATKYNSDGTSK